LISNVKVKKINLPELQKVIKDVSNWLRAFTYEQYNVEFEEKLNDYLKRYNDKYFPSPEFKIKARKKEIDEKSYAAKHEAIVLKKYLEEVDRYGIKLKQEKDKDFLINGVSN
jgi:hypothetical protein